MSQLGAKRNSDVKTACWRNKFDGIINIPDRDTYRILVGNQSCIVQEYLIYILCILCILILNVLYFSQNINDMLMSGIFIVTFLIVSV